MNKGLKKFTAVMLGLVLAFSLVGCGSKGGKEVSLINGSAKDALKGVTLKVGTSGLFPPFSYYDKDGKTLIGYDLDFLKALQEYTGFAINKDVQAMEYNALTTSLSTGKLDIGMAALCATDERKKRMNFTKTYYDSGQSLCINTVSSPTDLKSVEDLKSGKFVVAVEKGTASHLYCTKAGIPEKAIQVHDAITTAYESLEQGKVDCLIQDTPGLAYYIKNKSDTKLQMIGDEFNQGQAPYAVAISFDCSKANKGIVEVLDKAIKELTANGTMEKIQKKWCE